MKLILENWRKYLNEEEVPLSRPIQLYHGTATMPDMRNIASFRKGASGTTSLMGEQGRGFFVFTDKQRTLERLESDMAVPSTMTIDYEPIDFEEHGYPMIVTIEVSELDPKGWGLDLEAEENIIVDMLLETIEQWRPLVGALTAAANSIPTIGPPVDGHIDFSQTKNRKNQLAIPVIWTEGDGGQLQHKFLTFGNAVTGDPARARMLRKVLKYIEKKAPDIVSTKMFLEHALTRSAAIKYVGAEPLPVKKIEAQINGKWVDVTSQDPPALRDTE